MDTQSEPLDWKDRKILRELDENARQNFSKIAKSTRMSKQTIIYRMNNLIKNKVIKEFITYIDVQALGYTFYDIFFKLKYCSQEEENQMIKSILDMSEVGWFISTRGEWNLGVCVMAKTPEEFNKILERVLEILGNNTIDYDFFIVIEASQLPYKEVLEDYDVKPTFLGKKEAVKLNKKDAKVIKELAKNARESIINISSKTKLSIETVRYSIKKLENSGIIQSYKPLIDTIKLGYLWNIMLIKFNYCSDEKQKEFINFLKSQKQVFYLVKGVGNWSLMIEFHTKDTEEFDNIQRIIKSKFEKIIRDERIIQVLKEHKCIFLPDINV
jgi:Lrp/AsnC family leucine-responsive transcriptional regulator